MEDHTVLKDFVDDSIREIKDSIRQDLTEFRSMLLEFRGKNPEAWIVQAEHYFDFHKNEEDQKLNVASFYLDGEPLKCDDVKNEDKNDEEEIVTIRNKPIEFVIANANRPSFWINSIVSTTCDLSMFDICKALDDHWNQLFAYPVGLAQRWEEMPSISYTFNYAKLMSKVTNDGRNWNYVGCSIILSLDMRPELVEYEGYDLKCLGSQSNLVAKGIFLHVWDPGIHRQFVKLNNLNSGILFHIQTQDVLVNIKQLKRPICLLTVHHRESFLVGGGIEKWMVRRWNSQKVDH
ncbi:hypothetical protein KY285_000355 [Solanum tuberosum]|nr:hypothetical protein KY285_000355 [Solanum tuberosum]